MSEPTCTHCDAPITGIHWRVYLSSPSVRRVALVCAVCRPSQAENLDWWSRHTGGSAKWFRAVAP